MENCSRECATQLATTNARLLRKLFRQRPAKNLGTHLEFVPQGGTDYTAFIRGAPGFPMADDPLCEVGCPYAVRGFDYDYVGILWLNDLSWRNDRWIINLDAVHERGITNLVRQGRREKSQAAPATREVLQRTVQAYRILFTRALKGIYVWIPDAETRSYVEQSRL